MLKFWQPCKDHQKLQSKMFEIEKGDMHDPQPNKTTLINYELSFMYSYNELASTVTNKKC